MVEFYEDLYDEKGLLERRLKGGGLEGESLAEAQERFGTLCGILGEKKVTLSGDALADHWEEQIARGETPDLDMTLADLRKLKGWS